MDRDADDDPDTDERLLRPDSVNRRPRLRTSPNGVPAYAIDRPSRAMVAVSPEESGDALDPLDARIDARFDVRSTRSLRRVWRGLAGVAGAAIVALGAAAKGMLSDARSEGEAKVRIEVIERDLERLRTDLAAARMQADTLRGLLYRTGRRDEPDPPPITSASKRTGP